MKKIVFLFSIIVLLVGCKSDDDTNPDFYLNTESRNIIPYQLVKVSSNSMDFSQEEYIADFGGGEIPLAKNGNGDLIFLVPDVQPGDYKLTLNVEGRQGTLNFYVGNNNPNVETSVQENAIEPFLDFQAYSQGLLSQNTLSQQTADRLNSANEMITDLINQYESKPEEEKAKVAKFLNANKIFTEIHERKPLKGNKSADEFLCFIINSIRIMSLSDQFYSWNEIITPAVLQSTNIVTDDIIKVFTVVGIYGFSAQIEASIELVRDICQYPVSVKLYDNNGNSNDFIMQYNEYTTFDLKVGARRLIKEDINKSDPFISRLVTQIHFIESNWEDFKVINPIITNNSNWFSQWLSPSTNYLTVTSDIIPLSNSDTIIEIDGNHSFLTFEGTGMLSYGIIFVNSNSFSLRFDGDENSLPQTFEMKIKYDIDLFETIIEKINISLE